MPVIIRNLIVNAEVGKAETRSKQAIQGGSQNAADSNKQRILRLEELTDHLLQILRDQNER
ncbi:DUF5908 family protein [Mangrovivirga sp. M17]|uniref:DUF5908 family protein n=1 Tax=Mangrovivirga halotolerans TaxID=2993936 RepID=A0ABT3RQU7_9BACT|nr:DUF5908 family protein [Mangrovivirga halotolerans]MCX2743871.1 DUF5908 family protein [Mangrovivirga halotolerans]